MSYYCKIRNGRRVSFYRKTAGPRFICHRHDEYRRPLTALFDRILFSFQCFVESTIRPTSDSYKEYDIWKKLFSRGMDVIYEDGTVKELDIFKIIGDRFREKLKSGKIWKDSECFLTGLILLKTKPNLIVSFKEYQPDNGSLLAVEPFGSDETIILYENDEDYVMGKMMGYAQNDNSNIVRFYKRKLKEFPFTFQEE